MRGGSVHFDVSFADGRPAKVSTVDGQANERYVYGKDGKLKSIVFPGDKVSFHYDGERLARTEAKTVFSTALRYDAKGRISAQTISYDGKPFLEHKFVYGRSACPDQVIMTQASEASEKRVSLEYDTKPNPLRDIYSIANIWEMMLGWPVAHCPVSVAKQTVTFKTDSGPGRPAGTVEVTTRSYEVDDRGWPVTMTSTGPRGAPSVALFQYACEGG